MASHQTLLSLRPIEQFVERNPSAKRLMKLLASRRHWDRELEVAPFALEAEVPEASAHGLFKLFDSLELGRYLIGRHGRKTRFAWHQSISPAEVARHVLEAEGASPKESAPAAIRRVELSCALSGNRDARIYLPEDFDEQDVEVLRRFLSAQVKLR